VSLFGGAAAGAFLRFAGRLRFPTLFFLFLVVFVADLFVPDFIPLVDEIILGLLTLLFGAWRRRRSDRVDSG
jgi:hypothetical protein